MEKKFKNTLAIESSLSLLKAFSEELVELGYKPDETSGRYDWVSNITHLWINFDSLNGVFGFHNHNGSYEQVNLPQDWDLALKLASEFEIELPEYVVCTKSDHQEYTFGKIYKLKDKRIPNNDGYLPLDTFVLGEPYYSRYEFEPSTKKAYDAQEGIPVVKKGKWYGSKQQPLLLVYCRELTTDSIIGYGFNARGAWVEGENDTQWFVGNLKNVREASEAEVKAALLREANKRYPVGTTYLCAHHSNFKKEVSVQKFSVPNLNQVYGEHLKGCLFSKHRWAEIVSQTIEIKGYKVEKVDKDYTKVGCKTFENIELYDLYNFLDNHGGVYTFEEKFWSAADVKELINFIEKK